MEYLVHTDLGGGVGPQPGYMQLAPPPVHPGAPVTDRGFTGPGGAAGGARRRLAGKLFERQHSLQDPPIDPVSQRFGRDEVSCPCCQTRVALTHGQDRFIMFVLPHIMLHAVDWLVC